MRLQRSRKPDWLCLAMRFKPVIPLTAVLALVVLPAVANAKGGYGVVTPFQVGPLVMDGSTDADVRAFAGGPDRVTYCYGFACNYGGVWKTFIYRFPNHGLTEYTFNEQDAWYLEQFYTTLQRFRTPHGTKAGMSVREAERREHLRYNGGCGGLGLFRSVTDGSGAQFTSLVGFNYGPVQSRVVDLQVFGPSPLPC